MQHEVPGRGRQAPLTAVSAIVDEGNRVVFESAGSYIENLATGQKIPMHRKNNVFMLQLEASPAAKTKGGPIAGVEAVEAGTTDFRGRA